MTSEVGRRVFVGSVVGGLPMLGLAAAQSAHTTHTSGGSHPMEKAIEEQLRAAIAEMQGPRAAEGARRAAATLRLGAAHYQAQDADASFKSALRNAITANGRERLLARANDRDRLLSDVREYGLEALPNAAGQLPADHQALDTILRLGFTPVMLQAAEALERLSEQMGDGVQAASARGVCPNHEPFTNVLSIITAGMCLWNPIFCVIFTGMWVGVMIAITATYAYHGCYR